MGKKKFKALTGDESPRVSDLQTYVQQKDEEALKYLLRCPEGRWFIARMLKAEGLTAATFTGNSATFYNEGRRAVVIGIRDKIESLGKGEIKLLQQAEIELYDVEHYIFDEMGDD